MSAQPAGARASSEGERWTAAALADLRERRHRPAAWAAFLSSSLERSTRSTRSGLPELARHAAVWGLAGGAMWSAACFVTRRSRFHPHLFAGLAWWLAVWRMLDWHLGDGRGRRRTLPRTPLRRRRLDSTADLAFLTTAAVGAPLLAAGSLVPPAAWDARRAP